MAIPRMFLWLFFLTGILYPLCITVIAQLTFEEQAQGSLVYSQGKMLGSRLIGQNFKEDRYFWPRPSYTHYDALPSSGSNLGPTSKLLKNQVEEQRARWAGSHSPINSSQIPHDLLFASGSGLDPHISPEAAYFQIERIVSARRLEGKQGKERIAKLVDNAIEWPILGFVGRPHVNVLLLNDALDQQVTDH
jgi:K+-transporting ATPase ATPase C chain